MRTRPAACVVPIVILVGVLALPGMLWSQGVIMGVVLDATTGRPVDGAIVQALREDGSAAAGARSDAQGRFRLDRLPYGGYSLAVSRLGYQPATVEVEAATPELLVSVSLQPLPVALDPVVTTASRREEKALDAPASISVVGRSAIQERPSVTAVDHVTGLPGVDVSTSGISQHNVVVRGFSNAGSGALLTLADYRYAAVPSIRINAYNFIPLNDDDIERIEVVRGPAAALYGPNANSGVLHLVGRSPWSSPGTEVTLAAGDRDIVRGTLRHAVVMDDRLGVRLSSQYMRGTDWRYDDPYEIVSRDFHVARLAGSMEAEFRPDPRTSATIAIGSNRAISNLDVTGVGAAQVKGWTYGYVQARVRRDRLFAQMFLNASDAGETFLLRTGAPIVDRSRMMVAQVQHGFGTAFGTDLTWGLDLQRTVPRTEGTINGRNEDNDNVHEVGGYLHAEVPLASAVSLVAAVRGDHHDRTGGVFFSPRAALVVKPADAHTLRLTYNRAFSTPTINDLFLDIVADSIRLPTGHTLPVAIRVQGAHRGFTFESTACAGSPCMYSGFAPGGIAAPHPVDVSLIWNGLLDSLVAWGIMDLTGIPAPAPGQVGAVTGLLDAFSETFLPGSAEAVAPLRHTITNTTELGYKGVVGTGLLLGIDLYHTRVNGFVGHPRAVTPSVFFDRETLAAYLEGFMDAEEASQTARLASALPLATVAADGALDPADIVLSFRNVGDVTVWGADFSLAWAVTGTVSVGAAYSWVSRDYFTSGGFDVALNAPRNKGAVSLNYRNTSRGITGELRARYVQGFPVSSGVYVAGIPGIVSLYDPVESYTVLDAVAGYRLPFAPGITVTLSAHNLLDNRHREFAGVPEVGRLMLGHVRWTP